jgi:hypothetical protein
MIINHQAEKRYPKRLLLWLFVREFAVTDEDEEDEEDDIVWRESDGSDTIKNPITIEKIVIDFGFLKNSQIVAKINTDQTDKR